MVSANPQISLLLLSALCLLPLSMYVPCCTKYSTGKLSFSRITGVSIQTDIEYCSINAIIFHTKKGKACFDPALNWVIDYVNRYRNKAQMLHMKRTHT
uniref:Chemokine interleukin-8-like domain-containing protein n=1 Tax=Periophthalmus magnuspinnatus TaxID=409849 RepID=A0A3B4AMM3_9GOBI